MDMTLQSMVKVKNSLSVTLLIIQIPLWCIDEMCFNLAQQLRMMCRLKQRFQIADMTLLSLVKVTHTKNLSMAQNANSSYIF